MAFKFDNREKKLNFLLYNNISSYYLMNYKLVYLYILHYYVYSAKRASKILKCRMLKKKGRVYNKISKNKKKTYLILIVLKDVQI